MLLLVFSAVFHDDPGQSWPPPWLLHWLWLPVIVIGATVYFRQHLQRRIVTAALLVPVAIAEVWFVVALIRH